MCVDLYKRKPGRPRVSDNMVREWHRLRDVEGWSVRGIALFFGKAPSTVSRHLNGYYDNRDS